MAENTDTGDCCPIAPDDGADQINQKSVGFGPRRVRSDGHDVFVDKESARERSRQLGCIGIRQYNSVSGGFVWMPCSNESDYRRVTGVGVLAGRRSERDLSRRIARILKKKTDEVKALGPPIGGPQRDMNPATARNADNDPFVLEGIPTINRGRGVIDPTPGSDVAIPAPSTPDAPELSDTANRASDIDGPDLPTRPDPGAAPSDKPSIARSPKKPSTRRASIAPTDSLAPKIDTEPRRNTARDTVPAATGAMRGDKVTPARFILPENDELVRRVKGAIAKWLDGTPERERSNLLQRNDRSGRNNFFAQMYQDDAARSTLRSFIWGDIETADAAVAYWGGQFADSADRVITKIDTGTLNEADYVDAFRLYQKAVSQAPDFSRGIMDTYAVADPGIDEEVLFSNLSGWTLPTTIESMTPNTTPLQSFGAQGIIAITDIFRAAVSQLKFPVQRENAQTFPEGNKLRAGFTANRAVYPHDYGNVLLRRLLDVSNSVRNANSEPIRETILGSALNSFAMYVAAHGVLVHDSDLMDSSFGIMNNLLEQLLADKESTAVLAKMGQLFDLLDTHLVDYTEARRRARLEIIAAAKENGLLRKSEDLFDNDVPLAVAEHLDNSKQAFSTRNEHVAAVIAPIGEDKLRRVMRDIFARNNYLDGSTIEKYSPASPGDAIALASELNPPQRDRNITRLSTENAKAFESITSYLYSDNPIFLVDNNDQIQLWANLLQYGKRRMLHRTLKQMSPKKRAEFMAVDPETADVLLDSAKESWLSHRQINEGFGPDNYPLDDNINATLTNYPIEDVHYRIPQRITDSSSNPLVLIANALRLRQYQLDRVNNNDYTNSIRALIDGLLGGNPKQSNKIFDLMILPSPAALLIDRYANSIPNFLHTLGEYDNDIQGNNRGQFRNNDSVYPNTMTALGVLGDAKHALAGLAGNMDEYANMASRRMVLITDDLIDRENYDIDPLVENYLNAAPFGYGPSGSMVGHIGQNYPRDKRESGSWSPVADNIRTEIARGYQFPKKRNGSMRISLGSRYRQAELVREAAELLDTMYERARNGTLRLEDYATSYDQKTEKLKLDAFNPKTPASVLKGEMSLFRAITLVMTAASVGARTPKDRDLIDGLTQEVYQWADHFLPFYSSKRPFVGSLPRKISSTDPTGSMGGIRSPRERFAKLKNSKYASLELRWAAFDAAASDLIYESAASVPISNKLLQLETLLDDLINEQWAQASGLKTALEIISSHVDDMIQGGLPLRLTAELTRSFDTFAGRMRKKYQDDPLLASAFSSVNLYSVRSRSKRRRGLKPIELLNERLTMQNSLLDDAITNNQTARAENLRVAISVTVRNINEVTPPPRGAPKKFEWEGDDETPVSGSMAGRYSPHQLTLSNLVTGLHDSPEFAKHWQSMDDNNELFWKYRLESQQEPAGLSSITFNWTDEVSRNAYLRLLTSGKQFPPIYRTPGGRDGAIFPKSSLHKNSEMAKNISEYIADELGVGMYIRGRYPYYADMFSTLATFSLTPSSGVAGSKAVSDILSYHSEELNPTQFAYRFETWIRDPDMVMENAKTGKETGVRKFFNNDRIKMMMEFNKRIDGLYDIIEEKAPQQTFDNFRPRRIPGRYDGDISSSLKTTALQTILSANLETDSETVHSLTKRVNAQLNRWNNFDFATAEDIVNILAATEPSLWNKIKIDLDAPVNPLSGIPIEELDANKDILSIIMDDYKNLSFYEIKELLAQGSHADLYDDEAIRALLSEMGVTDLQVRDTANPSGSMTQGAGNDESSNIDWWKIPDPEKMALLRQDFDRLHILRANKKALEMSPDEERQFRVTQWKKSQLEKIIDADWVALGPFPKTNALRDLHNLALEATDSDVTFSGKIYGFTDSQISTIFDEISSGLPNSTDIKRRGEFVDHINGRLSVRGDDAPAIVPDIWAPEPTRNELLEFTTPKEAAEILGENFDFDRAFLAQLLNGPSSEMSPEIRTELLRITNDRADGDADPAAVQYAPTPQQQMQNFLINSIDESVNSAEDFVDSLSREQLSVISDHVSSGQGQPRTLSREDNEAERTEQFRQQSALGISHYSATQTGRNQLRTIASLMKENTKVQLADDVIDKIILSASQDEISFDAALRALFPIDNYNDMGAIWFHVVKPLTGVDSDIARELQDVANESTARMRRHAFVLAIHGNKAKNELRHTLYNFVKKYPVDGVGSVRIAGSNETTNDIADLSADDQNIIRSIQFDTISSYDGTTESANRIIGALTSQQIERLFEKFILPALHKSNPGLANKRSINQARIKMQKQLARINAEFSKSPHGVSTYTNADGYGPDDITDLITTAANSAFGDLLPDGTNADDFGNYVSLVDYFFSGGREILPIGEYAEAARKLQYAQTRLGKKQSAIAADRVEMTQLANDAGAQLDSDVASLLKQFINRDDDDAVSRALDEEEFARLQEQKRRHRSEIKKYNVQPADSEWEEADDVFEIDNENPSGSMLSALPNVSPRYIALLDAKRTPRKKHDDEARSQFSIAEKRAIEIVRNNGIDIPNDYTGIDSQTFDGTAMNLFSNAGAVTASDIEKRLISIQKAINIELEKIIVSEFPHSEFRADSRGLMLYVPARLLADGPEAPDAIAEFEPYDANTDDDLSLRPQNFDIRTHPTAVALRDRHDNFTGAKHSFGSEWLHENTRYGTETNKLLQLLESDPSSLDMDKILAYVESQGDWMDIETLPLSSGLVTESPIGRTTGFGAERRSRLIDTARLEKEKKIVRSKALSSKALRDSWWPLFTGPDTLDEIEIAQTSGYLEEAVIAGLKTVARENGQIDNFDRMLSRARQAGRDRAQELARSFALAKIVEIIDSNESIAGQLFHIDSLIQDAELSKDVTSKQYQARIRAEILKRVSSQRTLLNTRKQLERYDAITTTPRDYLYNLQKWDANYGPILLQLEAGIQDLSIQAEASLRALRGYDETVSELQERVKEIRELADNAAEFIRIRALQRATDDALQALSDDPNNIMGDGSSPSGSMKRVGRHPTTGVAIYAQGVQAQEAERRDARVLMTPAEKEFSQHVLRQLNALKGLDLTDINASSKIARQSALGALVSGNIQVSRIAQSVLGLQRTARSIRSRFSRNLVSNLRSGPDATISDAVRNSILLERSRLHANELTPDYAVFSELAESILPAVSATILSDLRNIGRDKTILKHGIFDRGVSLIEHERSEIMNSIRDESKTSPMSTIAERLNLDLNLLRRALDADLQSRKLAILITGAQEMAYILKDGYTKNAAAGIISEKIPELGELGITIEAILDTPEHIALASLDNIELALRHIAKSNANTLYVSDQIERAARSAGIPTSSINSLRKFSAEIEQTKRYGGLRFDALTPDDWRFMTYGEQLDWLDSDMGKTAIPEEMRQFQKLQLNEMAEAYGSLDGPYGATASALRRSNISEAIFGMNSVTPTGESPIFSWVGLKDSDLVRSGKFPTKSIFEKYGSLGILNDVALAAFFNTQPGVIKKLRSGKFGLSTAAASRVANALGVQLNDIWSKNKKIDKIKAPNGHFLWIAGNWSVIQKLLEMSDAHRSDAAIEKTLGKRAVLQLAQLKKLQKNKTMDAFGRAVGKTNPSDSEVRKYLLSVMPTSKKDAVLALAQSGYGEQDIIGVTGFNANTVRNILHDLRRAGIAPDAVGKKIWIMANADKVIADMAGGMSKRQAMRKYGVGAETIRSILTESNAPIDYQNASDLISGDSPSGSMANRRVGEDVEQVAGPTPAWDSDDPSVRVFLPEFPPTVVAEPYSPETGPASARLRANGAAKDQDALNRWRPSMAKMLNWVMNGGVLENHDDAQNLIDDDEFDLDATSAVDEPNFSITMPDEVAIGEAIDGMKLSVDQMDEYGAFPGIGRAMNNLFEQAILSLWRLENQPRGAYDGADMDGDFRDMLEPDEDIDDTDGPGMSFSDFVSMVVNSLDPRPVLITGSDADWLNEFARSYAASRNTLDESTAENADRLYNLFIRKLNSSKDSKQWMQKARFMVSIQSMANHVIDKFALASFNASMNFDNPGVVDDQVAAHFFDRVLKSIYDLPGADLDFVDRVIGKANDERNATMIDRPWADEDDDIDDHAPITLSASAREQFNDAANGIASTVAQLFSDQLAYHIGTNSSSDPMVGIFPRKDWTGQWTIYGPDIVYAGYGAKKPYNRSVRWSADPSLNAGIVNFDEDLSGSPDKYLWEVRFDADGEYGVSALELMQMDASDEFGAFISHIARNRDANEIGSIAKIINDLIQPTKMLHIPEGMTAALRDLSEMMQYEIETRDDFPGISSGNTANRMFPWIDWNKTHDLYPVLNMDDIITGEQRSWPWVAKRAVINQNLRRVREYNKMQYGIVMEMTQDLHQAEDLIEMYSGLIAALKSNAEFAEDEEMLGRIADAERQLARQQDFKEALEPVIGPTIEQLVKFTAGRLESLDSVISVGEMLRKIAIFDREHDARVERKNLLGKYKRTVLDVAQLDRVTNDGATSNKDDVYIPTFNEWLGSNGYEYLTYEYKHDEIPPSDAVSGSMALHRYTKPGLLAIVHGHEEAKKSDHNEVSVPHLLLGLARENIGKRAYNQTIAGRVLKRLNVDINKLRTAINEIIAPGAPDGNKENRIVPISANARTVMVRAVKQAMNKGQNFVGTDHLLLAIASANDKYDDSLSGVLSELGITKEQLIAETIAATEAFNMGSFPNEAGPSGSMQFYPRQTDDQRERARAFMIKAAGDEWFTVDRVIEIVLNIATDKQQVDEFERLLDEYVVKISSKQISANDYRNGMSPFSVNAILQTNSALIFGDIGQEPTDLVGAIAYRMNVIDVLTGIDATQAARYATIRQQAKLFFDTDSHAQIFDGEKDAPSGSMDGAGSFGLVYEPIGKMFVSRPQMPQDEYYQSIYGPALESESELRKAAAAVNLSSPLNLDLNLTYGDDDDVTWSSNAWSIAKTSFIEGSDAVIMRMQGNDITTAQLLMIDRKSGPFTNAKALVGGLRDGDEDYMTTATREGLEEVGIDLNNSISGKALGLISTPDWDPRFVKGTRVGGGFFMIPWDTKFQAASDAKKADWVSLSEIAEGKHAIAFGHAEWIRRAVTELKNPPVGDGSIDKFHDMRVSIARRLNILAKAQRLRNQRIISRINAVRREKGAEEFLPEGLMPHPLMPWGVAFESDRWPVSDPSGSMSGPIRPFVDVSLARDLGLIDDYKTDYSLDELNSSNPVSTAEKYGLMGGKISDARYNGLWMPYINRSIKRALDGSADRNPEDLPTAYILGGSSGTGKTYARMNGFMGIPSYDNAVVADPDDAKIIMPEVRHWFGEMNPNAANLAHIESRAITAKLTAEAIKRGIDLVYDTSGQFNDGTSDIEKWKKKGYKVVAHYFFAPDDVLATRNNDRFKRTGRMVPEWIPPVINRNLSMLVPQMDSLFDELHIWDSEKDPTSPVALARRGQGEPLEILNKKLYGYVSYDKR